MISTYPWKNGARFFIPGMLLLAAMVAQPAAAQQGDYDSESLFIALFANGDALVEYDISISDPLDEEIRINLFGGTHINDLIVVDLDDELVDYDIGGSPNEIILNTPGVENVRISYTTPDLANRNAGIWTFSVNTTTSLIVRLPVDSVLVDAEPIPAIRFVNDQPLLTFNNPGGIQVTYSIGVLGTEDQANIAIQVATAAIREARTNYPGIVLAEAQGLLDRATVAMGERRFSEAESLAGQANEVAVAAGRNYVAAQNAISDAEAEVTQAGSQGRDVAAAQELLGQAKNQFAVGDYLTAKTSAENAVAAIRDMPEPQMPVGAIIAGAAAAAGGVGALLFLKMRKRPVPATLGRETPRTAGNGNSTSVVRPPAAVEEEKEIADSAMNDPPEQNSVQIEPNTIPDSQLDKSVLGRIVIRILEERAHLRPEDQQVLRYLAEKEGAAFESEIRTKFQLPKTTIWRLVKRLEREELVEIRKAGGQNLIKLKFEDKQA